MSGLHLLFVTSGLYLLGLEYFPLKTTITISVSYPHNLFCGRPGRCQRTGSSDCWPSYLLGKVPYLAAGAEGICYSRILQIQLKSEGPFQDGILPWNPELTQIGDSKSFSWILALSSKDSVKSVPPGSHWGT